MTKFSTRLTLSLRCFLHGKPPDELLQTQQTKLVALEQKLVPRSNAMHNSRPASKKTTVVTICANRPGAAAKQGMPRN